MRQRRRHSVDVFAKHQRAGGQQRRRNHKLVEQGFLGTDPIERADLDDQRRRRPGQSSADEHKVAERLVRTDRRRRQAESDADADEGHQQTEPLRKSEMIAGHQPARSDHDKERRQIEEQRATRHRRPDQPAIDQQEFEGEEHAGQETSAATYRRDGIAVSRAPASMSPTSTAAITERDADWISGGMSWIASLIATLLKPQLRHSPIVTATAKCIERTGRWRRARRLGHVGLRAAARDIIACGNASRCRQFRSTDSWAKIPRRARTP